MSCRDLMRMSSNWEFSWRFCEAKIIVFRCYHLFYIWEGSVSREEETNTHLGYLEVILWVKSEGNSINGFGTWMIFMLSGSKMGTQWRVIHYITWHDIHQTDSRHFYMWSSNKAEHNNCSNNKTKTLSEWVVAFTSQRVTWWVECVRVVWPTCGDRETAIGCFIHIDMREAVTPHTELPRARGWRVTMDTTRKTTLEIYDNSMKFSLTV